MKTAAEKSSAPTRTRSTHTSAAPFFAPQNAVQTKLTVNTPGDKFEQEAERAANRVMRMPAAVSNTMGSIQRAPAVGEKVQRSGDGAPGVDGSTQSAIQQKASAGGQPLSADVRSYMEPRFGADFSGVRVHTDAESAGLSNRLGARAFTTGNSIFFARDQYQPGSGEGRHLIAHELTHTIQQGHAVQRSPAISASSATPAVQRWGVQQVLDKFAEWGYNIPGFRMLTIALGFNPINMRRTERSAANILRALIELIPGGHFITQALDNHGVFARAGAWVQQKLDALGDIGGAIVKGIKRFIDSLSWSDAFDLGGVWDRAKRIFTDPIAQLIAFGKSVAVEILTMVKDAILKPLAALAQKTRGYDLLKAILGEDPITRERVPRTAETLIGGFMKLIGQEEVWENIRKGRAIERAWKWFDGALSGLMGIVASIPGRIKATLASLTFVDIITVIGALGKIIGMFGNIAVDFFSWAGKQVLSLLEILFSVVAPGVMPYIAKARTAFTSIVKNPIGFVGNLVRAGRLGFQMFANNIVTHLKTALINWLVGPLAEAGVYIPKSFTLLEIVKLVLSVLGLTWANIRTKLLKIIPESVLTPLEKTSAILVALVKDGPAAAWEQIKTELTELQTQLVGEITSMITNEVVKAAVLKLVTMLNPAGAVIQAIIAIYNTVTFFIQKIQQIAAVVASFIDSIAAIAAGQVNGAAKRVEATMVRTLTIIIGFLAKFAGVGGIPEKLVGIVKRIRAPIDRGLEKIVTWLGTMLKKVGNAVAGKSGKPDTRTPEQRVADRDKALAEATTAQHEPDTSEALLKERLVAIKEKYKVASLELVVDSQTDSKETVHVVVTNSEPRSTAKSAIGKEVERTMTEPVFTERTLPGCSETMGDSMVVDWVGPKPASGTPPESGVHRELMSRLSTDPRMASEDKYIRGHLLNEHLGGRGFSKNLFPITGFANKEHLHSTEKKVKAWLGVGRAKSDVKKIGPQRWVKYTVKVTGISSKLTAPEPEDNYVNATFSCHALVKDADGKTQEEFSTSIPSRYTKRAEAKLRTPA